MPFTHVDVYKTRKTLIERCREADPEAWFAFYKPYRDFARYIMETWYFDLSQTEVEDLSHEVMVKVSKSMAKFDPDRPSRRHPDERVKFHNWFWNQVRTVLRLYLNQRGNRKKIFEYNPEIDADMAKFDDQFYAQREEAIKTKAMELLAKSRTNPRTVEAYQMQLAGRDVSVIAQELGMPENSVHQAVCRCRRALEKHRRELEELL